VSESATRWFMKHVLPIAWHRAIRDSGAFRVIGDYGAVLIGLGLTLTRPWLPYELWTVRRAMTSVSFASTYRAVADTTSSSTDNRVASSSLPNEKTLDKPSSHVLEVIDLSVENTTVHLPIDTERVLERPVRPVLVFVHGGAWGSGRTWQYTLMARNFGRFLNASHVVLVGYPYYPAASVSEQRDSVLAAIYHIHQSEEMKSVLAENGSAISSPVGSLYRPLILSGHSSGANICALALFHHFHEDGQLFDSRRFLTADRAFVDQFIALSGVYDIEKHYEFESMRGVQHLSPMGAAARSEEYFWKSSPTLLIHSHLRQQEQQQQQQVQEESHNLNLRLSHRPPNFPFVTTLHGDEDDVVPHSSTLEYEQAMSSLGIPFDSYYPNVSILSSLVITMCNRYCMFDTTIS
jgi:acetyl esterase/lipase